jgi:glycosyltransferase involved in cell wall biosynthesis
MDEVEYHNYASSMREERLRLYGKSLYEEAIRFGQMGASWSKNQPHEVIHSHDWMTYPAGIRAKQVSGRPWVAHIHATEYDRTGGQVNSQIAEIEYQGLNQADRVIAVSNYTRDIVYQYYSVPKEKIVVVHNGVDMEEFCPANFRRVFAHDQIVLFVGRLTMQKGVEYFLRAAKKVLESKPRTIFIVAGSGDLEHKLMLEAAYMGIGHRVVFPGFLSGEKLKACYQMADAFVMPSISEPYGIVALEAIANGVPAVISKQSGVSESLNNVFKVDFWDVNQMAQMIETVLDYPQLAKEMAVQAKREAEALTWDRAAEKVLQVYQNLV